MGYSSPVFLRPNMSASVYIVAVENSADHLGAELAQELRGLSTDIRLSGIGGANMKAAGLPSQMDIEGLAILGLIEGLASYPKILRKVKEAADRIMASGADAVVLIDSWGFMIRVAKRLRRLGFKGQVIKYVAPQVWAMRAGRSKILAEYTDHVLTIHNFDAPYFERHGLPVHYVGNPVFDTDYQQGHTDKLKDEYALTGRDVIAVFFGSRPSEIARLSGAFADAVARLRETHPEAAFVSPVSSSIAKEVAAAAGADLRLQDIILLPEKRKFEVMAAADVALACSGTVTTQLACAGIPTVVAYKMSPVTYFIGKRLINVDYISIVNIAADRPLMPEYIQHEASGDNLASAVTAYLDAPEKAQEVGQALLAQTEKMRGQGGSASRRAADAILSIIAT